MINNGQLIPFSQDPVKYKSEQAINFYTKLNRETKEAVKTKMKDTNTKLADADIEELYKWACEFESKKPKSDPSAAFFYSKESQQSESAEQQE